MKDFALSNTRLKTRKKQKIYLVLVFLLVPLILAVRPRFYLLIKLLKLIIGLAINSIMLIEGKITIGLSE